MIMCVLLCYPVSIRIYYQQGVLFLVNHQIAWPKNTGHSHDSVHNRFFLKDVGLKSV